MGVCSSCGAGINPSKLNCEYCSTPIENKEGVPYEVFIKTFGDSLVQAEDKASEKRENLEDNEYSGYAALINNLHIPAETSSLVQLAAFTIGQIHSSTRHLSIYNILEKQVVASAWLGKANEVLNKIEFMSEQNTQVLTIKDRLEKAISDGENRISEVQKSVKLFYAALAVVFALIGIGAIFVAIFG